MSNHTRMSDDNLIFDSSRTGEFADRLTSVLGHPPDLVDHSFVIQQPELEGRCLFLETLVDKNKIEDNVLRMFAEQPLPPLSDEDANVEDMVKRRIPIATITGAADLATCTQRLLEGQCLLFIPGATHVLVLDVAKFQHRAVTEPKTETTVRGPQEALNEDAATSIGLIRKRIRTSDLCLEQMIIGTATETKVIMLYMKSLAPEGIVNEFRSRIGKIHTDSILEGTYVEEWIQDKCITIFPTIVRTERPDVVVSHLLEGRVTVMVDGSPLVLIGPFTFMQSFTSPEDYYQRADIATFFTSVASS
ncbi:spore germination protein, partial [Bacillus cereus]|nr:spore germination protein [Bacillus cereus]